MRKKCRFLFMLVMMFLMTGCVKYNANMDIRKDKSMDFKIIYAVDTTYFGEIELVETEERDNLRKSGFTVENYEAGSMKGVSISKMIKNIDTVSSTEDTKYSVSGIFDANAAGSALFKVKKGLFKNVYVADLTFDSNDSSLSDDSDEELDECNPEYEDCVGSVNPDLDEEMNFPGLESAMQSIDMSFNVTLPYAAISNNATEVTNDGKNLKWKLTTDDVASMQFQFALYNMTTIYIMIGAGIVLLTIIVLLIIKKISGSKKKEVILNQTVMQSVPFNGMATTLNSGVAENNMFETNGAVLPANDNVLVNTVEQTNVMFSQPMNTQPEMQNNMYETNNAVSQVNDNVLVNTVEQSNAIFSQPMNTQPELQNNMFETNNDVLQVNDSVLVNTVEQTNAMFSQPMNTQSVMQNNMFGTNNGVSQVNDNSTNILQGTNVGSQLQSDVDMFNNQNMS